MLDSEARFFRVDIRIAGWIFIGVIAKVALSLVLFPWLLGSLGEAYQALQFYDQYDLIASNLLNGHGYRVFPETTLTMLREPGFPLLLAGLFFLFGKNLAVVQFVQLLMSFATGLLAFDLARKLVVARSAAILACVIVLFHPGTLVAETRGGIESTLMLAYTGCVWLAVRALERDRYRDYIALGVVVGATMLLKSSTALFLPLILLIRLAVVGPRGESLPQTLGKVVAAGICAAVVMTPWIARNYQISGEFVPTMTSGGLALFQGVHLVKHQHSDRKAFDVLIDAAAEQLRIAQELSLKVKPGFFPQFYTPADELRFYRELRRRGLQEYRDNPTLILKAVTHNALGFWFQGRTPKATLLNVVLTLPLLLLMLIGVYQALRDPSRDRRSTSVILIVGLVALMLPHLLIIALARYHVPVLPLMAIFAAIPLSWYWSRTERASRTVAPIDSAPR